MFVDRKNSKRATLFLLCLLFMTGCATLPISDQPSVTEKYGIIKAENGIFLESIDDKHFGYGLYGCKDDVRVSPGEHIVQMHYDSPGIFMHYSGSKLPLLINVKEGMRYFISAELKKYKYVNMPESWKPIISKEEPINGYWLNRPN